MFADNFAQFRAIQTDQGGRGCHLHGIAHLANLHDEVHAGMLVDVQDDVIGYVVLKPPFCTETS